VTILKEMAAFSRELGRELGRELERQGREIVSTTRRLMARGPAPTGPGGERVRQADLTERVATPSTTGARPVIAERHADGMTPGRLGRILRAADDGDPTAWFELAAEVEMRDLHYLGVLGTRKRAIAQLPIAVHAASDKARDVEMADFVRAWIDTGRLRLHLFHLLDAIGKGISVTEVSWQMIDGRWQPAALAYVDPRWLVFDRRDGNTPLLREAGGPVDGMARPIDPWRHLIHRHPAASGLTINTALTRAVVWAWLLKSYTVRDWALFVQGYGKPLRVGRYHQAASENDKETLWQAVRSIASDMAAIIPAEMSMEFIEVKSPSGTGELYERRADWIDRQVSKAVLGQTTTTDAVSGGHAVAQEHRLVQEDIERADALLVSATLTQGLVPWMIALNWGPQPRYPVIAVGRPDEIPLDQLISAIEKMGPLGLTVEASVIRDRLGIPDPPQPKAGAPVELIGGRPPAPAAPATPAPTAAVALNSLFTDAVRRELHAVEPRDALDRRRADELETLISGPVSAPMTAAIEQWQAQIQAELEAASDLTDALDRLGRLKLSREEFDAAITQAMGIAHLAGEAAARDRVAAAREEET
jgi:phage gp29-like protein